MKKLIPFAFLTALCVTVPALSEPSRQGTIASGADLTAACNGAESNVCSAYIAGYAQGFYYATVGASAGVPACIPHGVPDAQARQIVITFMSEHPEMAQQGAASVVAEALLVAFPCAHPR